MMTKAITRRGFVAASAATAALAASGTTLYGCATDAAQAAEHTASVVNTQCSACPKQCGYAAYVVDGSLDKVIGNATHPYAAGTLCARGFGSATESQAENRLNTPLRKNAAGFYDEIDWDTAITEIASSLKTIATDEGPQAIAAITDGTSTAQWYTSRLLAAYGSPNTYVSASAANTSIASGLALATGYSSYEPDYANAKVIVILGASTVDSPDPGTIAGLEAAKEAGAQIVMVDNRMSQSSSLATEYLGVHAGTELALVLSLAHELLNNATLYQAAAASMEGLDQWKAALSDYTPQWAAEITGAPADSIVSLSQSLAKAAPAACIDVTWMAMFGGSYANTGELARAVALTNTVLGCWNTKGGAYVAAPVDWTSCAFAPVATTVTDITATEAPLAVDGSAATLIRLAHDGSVRGLILVDANVVAEYPDPTYVEQALAACSLTVAVTPTMTETAKQCTYVLPELVWSESAQIPVVSGAKTPVVAVSSAVVEPAVDNARSVADIMTSIASSAGLTTAFPQTVEEAAAALCDCLNTDYDGACAVGTVAFGKTNQGVTDEATVAVWPTASGKVECVSAVADAAGVSACPVWVAPVASDETEGLYRLTTGNQALLFATELTDLAPLASIAKEYDLEGIWINADEAARAGIAEGDKVAVSNDHATATLNAHVTQLIEPSAVYMACHYGVENEDEKNANDLGVRQASFVPFALETGYGAPLLQESMVTITKAGA
ncbi:molybdopterin-dependent oxidoreductase [Eggerthellaceae bacterium 3-80]|nr:hypothetical protein D7W09_01385 [bacterium D16-34]